MSRSGKAWNRRRVASLAGAAVGLAVIAWVASLLFDFGGSRVVRVDPAALVSAGPSGLAPVEMPVAQLADYYEHGVEHAPPRDPTGCMQRREARYAAPPADPCALVRSKLTTNAADAALRRWLDRWEAGWRQGDRTDARQLRPLEELLPPASLDAVTLLDVGRAIDFLDGDEHAACWYRAGIAKAQTEYAKAAPGSPAAVRPLALLDQTRALWRLKDHAALERRFALAMRLNAPLSPEARRAGYLHAEMLYYQRKYPEAADAMFAVQAEHDRAGDLGMREASDLYEMHWVLGLFASGARRYEAALPHLTWLARQPGGERAGPALRLLSQAQSELGQFELGQFEQAAETLSAWERQYAA